jgi:hypothetical protein
MEAYRVGLAGRLLEYAVKKYRGHRMLPGDIDTVALALEYAAKKEMMNKAKNNKK